MILDYLGGPNVIIRVLERRQEYQSQRSDKRRGQRQRERKICRCSDVGFAEIRRGRKLRNAGVLRKLGKYLFRVPRRNAALVTP